VFNRFYRLEIHSLNVGIFDLACELDEVNVQYIKTVCSCGGVGGGVELCCRPYSVGV
jgi:hypothetical protein